MAKTKRYDHDTLDQALRRDGWRQGSKEPGLTTYRKPKTKAVMYLHDNGTMRIGTHLSGTNPVDVNRWMIAHCKRHRLPGLEA